MFRWKYVIELQRNLVSVCFVHLELILVVQKVLIFGRQLNRDNGEYILASAYFRGLQYVTINYKNTRDQSEVCFEISSDRNDTLLKELEKKKEEITKYTQM